MSREGARIAALDRARRLQAALGADAPVLMGCTLIVLHDAPRRAVTAVAPAANEPQAAAGAAAAKLRTERSR